DKTNPALRYYLGMTFLKLDSFHEAKKSFKQSIELDPSFHDSKIQLAMLTIHEKKYNEAYSMVNDILAIDPNHVSAMRLTAQLAFDLRDFRRTIEILQPFIQKDPSHIKDLEILLNAWLMLSQPEKAHKFMNQLINQNKELPSQLKSIAFFDQFLDK
ncbi:MAG: tetratricopeptide repeat protein, partial [Candidatus Hodarchaeales archaeon]